MKTIRAAVAVIALAASTGRAQQRGGWELGLDAGLFRTSLSGSDVGTRFELPVRAIRAGVPVARTLVFEPVLNIQRTSAGNANATSFALDLALVANLSPERQSTQWFVRPFFGYQQSTNSGLIASRTSLGFGTGLRVGATNRVFMRYEARYRYLPARRGVSGDELGLLAGISVLTR